MKTRSLVASVVIMVLAVLPALPSQAAGCPERTGHWPYGPTMGVALHGDYALYGVGTVLRIADVSSPENPQVVAELRLEHVVRGITVSGTTVFAAVSERGLVAVDVADPVHPAVVDELGGIDMAVDLVIDGSIAWVAARDAGLVAVDIATPSDLQLEGSLAGLGTAWDVAISGNLVVVTSVSQGVFTIDISSPGSPTQLGHLDIELAQGLDIRGDYAYACARNLGVQVVDISDHALPELITTVPVGHDYCYETVVAGDLLLVANRLDGMKVFDLDDPTTPVEIGRLDTGGQVRDMVTSGSLVLIADEYAGLAIGDLSDPTAPQETATLEGYGEVTNLSVSGSLAAVTSVGDVLLYDLSNPADPELLSTYASTRYIQDLALANDHLYLAEYHQGLRIFNVSDPTSPQETGFLALEDARKVAVVGTRAVVASLRDGLRVIDVSDPTAPVSLGQVDMDYRPGSLIINGDVAYTTDYSTGLYIYDLSAPTMPEQAGQLAITGADHAVCVSGDLLFVGVQGFGVMIYDISDPLAPSELSQYTALRYFSGLAAAGNLLGIASIYNGFHVLDVSDPANPLSVASTAMAQDSEADAEAVGNLIVVTELYAGIEVFDLSDCPGGTPVADFSWAPGSPEAGQTVQLTDASTGTITNRSWDLGGGATSSERNPTHTWDEPGSYEVSLTVSSTAGTDTITRTITVTEVSAPPITDPGELVWVIPAAARTSGAHGTSWVTDVVLHNPGAAAVDARLYFMKAGRDNSSAVAQTVSVAASSSVELTDIVLTQFTEGSASGAILIAADEPLLITSRTYNDAPGGTFGQFIPGLPLSEATGRLESVRLIQLTRNDDFRTNIGFANPTGSELVVTVQLLDAAGAEIDDPSFSVPAYGYRQVNDIIGGDVDDATALISSNTVNAAYFVYASVVDNDTGDPVLVLEAEEAGELYLAAAAHVDGFEGTQWRTDLEVFNDASAATSCRVELLETGQANPSPSSAVFTVGSGAALRSEDVLDELLGFSGTGALRVSVDSGHGVVTSRTYNWTAAGTYGQLVAGVTAANALTTGDTGRLLQLHQSADDASGFRTNIGLLNVTAAPVVVDLVLYRSDGSELGPLAVTLAAYEHRQLNRALREVTRAAVRNGYALLSTGTPGGRFLAYASVVDNVSGDPVYMPVLRSAAR